MSGDNYPSVPSVDEFAATFGCESSVNDDLIQTCLFEDKHSQSAKVVFGLLDNSFGVSISRGNLEVFNLYDEFLEEAVIDEDDQSIKIYFNHNGQGTIATLKVWPTLILQINAMR